MDDASPPGQRKPEVPREEVNLLPREEDQEVKAVLDWGLEGLGPDTPIKMKGDDKVAQEHREPAVALGREEPQKQQQRIQAGVVKPKEEKTLGQRFEEMRKTREERDMEKSRRKAQKAKEPRYEEEAE